MTDKKPTLTEEEIDKILKDLEASGYFENNVQNQEWVRNLIKEESNVSNIPFLAFS